MANVFTNHGLAVTNTETDIYQCPANKTAVVITLRITNIDGTNQDQITAKVTNSSNTNIAHIASTVQVPADSSVELAGTSKIVLEAQDKIRLTGVAASSDLEGFLSVLEIDN